MAKQTGERIAEASAEALAESAQAAEKIVKGNAEALVARVIRTEGTAF